jgi:hypothetical protein
MDEPFAATLATVAAGRAAAVGELRLLADRLALDDAAEVLVLLGPVLDNLRRQAALVFERLPAAR